MGKMIMIIALILLGLFTVLVINNNTSAPKPAEEKALALAGNISPTPSEQQNILNEISATPSSQIENLTATIKTNKGDIEIILFSKEAPNTVANFIKKAQDGYYENLIFHRVEDWVIQGGDPLGNGTGGGDMPTELNNKPFITGSLGIARGQDIRISNDSQFFINKTDATWLNGQYTNFGKVTIGMDVVKNIKIEDKILGIEIK